MSANQTLAISRGLVKGSDYGEISKTEDVTLEKFADVLRNEQAKSVRFTFDELAAAPKEKRDELKIAPWYSCATFQGSRRKKKHLVKCTAVVLDADKPPMTRETLLSALNSLGCAYIAVTSTSHNVDGQARYRVIVPLAIPVQSTRYESLWTYLSERLPGVDPGAKDATRLSYMPRVPQGAIGHEVVLVNTRPWLDATTVCDTVRTAEPRSGDSQCAAIVLTPDQRADLKSALAHLAMDKAAGTYGFWAEVGLGLLRLDDVGRRLWQEFSALAANPNPDETAEDWWQKNQNTKAVSDYTHLFKMAAARGWENPVATRISESADFPDGGNSPLTAAPSRTSFKFEKLPSDILTCSFAPRDWAIWPYFPRGTVSILSSIGGFGKSHLLILVAICKALGIADFCGLTCSAGRVVILTAEDDSSEMQRRAQRVLQRLVHSGVALDYALLESNLQIVDLTGRGSANMLVRTFPQGAMPTQFVSDVVSEIGTADMIAFDTQSRFSGASENDNIAGAVFISACETIAKLTSAAVVVLSHTGKAPAREGIVDQYVSRGASAFSDNARSVLVLAAPSKTASDELAIDEDAVARGDVFRLTHVKSNYAKKAADVYFKRFGDGVVMSFQPMPKLRASMDELHSKLLRYIGARETRRNDIYNNFRDIFGQSATRTQAVEVFENAVRDGQLIRKRSYRGANYYGVIDTLSGPVIDAPTRSNLECTRADSFGDLL